MSKACAGSVVFRQNERSYEVLLISARKKPSEWCFPKGSIEDGETAENAAIREV